ncbi:MAG: TatD family hydrolase [Fibrobacter sp.]|nr:TatD family hydrolase [Fibrobacter sp.]
MMLDFHLHLARLPRPLALARELKALDYAFVAVACEPWEWDAIADIFAKMGDDVETNLKGVAYGIHPMVATQTIKEHLDRLEELLLENSGAIVGEAGLDKRYPGYEEGGIQEQVFVRQVEMAYDLGRDLQIHCVGDYGRIIRILKKAGFGKTAHPIFHRFGGDSGIVKAALPLGSIFSLHKDSFRKKSTADAIKEIPAENIRFETDADESWTEILNGSDAQNAAALAKELGKISV